MLHCPSWPTMDQRRWRPNSVEIAPNCPRCASSNTKFCYYNNYSLSQPRYFCKGCRRYWTKGGSLRNVPVGGGCRKSRRAKSSAMRASRSESTFSATYGSSFNGSSPLGDSSSSRQSGTSGSDIDLAAVFAKYLGQGSDFEKPDFMTNQELAREANVGCINPGEAIEESDLMLVGDCNRRQELEERQDMINDFSVENDQTLLSDHEMTVQDCTLWSDSTNELQNLTWQPMVQLEEFDSFSTDDQLEIISADLTRDINNWNSASFDLYSGLEVFSRP